MSARAGADAADCAALLDPWFALGSVEWGRTDCAALSADVLRRVTGVDPAADWRGPGGGLCWGEPAGRGVLTRMRRAMAQPGFRPVDPAAAPPLALGLADLGNWTFGLNRGGGWWVFRADSGALAITGEMVQRAWIWNPT